jgi:hypothetical protein
MSTHPATAAPSAVVAELVAETAGIRSCALLATEGEVLAASGEADWSRAAAAMWEAATDRRRPEPTQIHVATDEGEVFIARDEVGVTAIAVTDRFPLASLVFCDLRAALRQVAAGAA